MTIYELKRRNIASGGYFFGRRQMGWAGDTLKGFSVKRGSSPNTVIVTRKRNDESMTFNRITGRVSIP
jgi:hypothetical protein